MEELFIIAGLGNPGNRYDNTRHNVGFEAVDLLAHKYSISINRLKFKALSGEGTIGGKRVMLVKPQTFMNLSGEALREIMEWYKLPIDRLLVIYDDIDLDMGKIRVRGKGSSGTHNGMKSIIYQLQNDGFPRVRIGIGKPPVGWDLADFVLSKFGPESRKIMNESIDKACGAVATFLSQDLNSAMNIYNK